MNALCIKKKNRCTLKPYKINYCVEIYMCKVLMYMIISLERCNSEFNVAKIYKNKDLNLNNASFCMFKWKCIKITFKNSFVIFVLGLT